MLFAGLLDAVAGACPEMRVRFTSPHPKDFGDDVLQARAARLHLSKQVLGFLGDQDPGLGFRVCRAAGRRGGRLPRDARPLHIAAPQGLWRRRPAGTHATLHVPM